MKRSLTILGIALSYLAVAQTESMQSIDSANVPSGVRNAFWKVHTDWRFKDNKDYKWYRDDYTEDNIHYVYLACGKDNVFGKSDLRFDADGKNAIEGSGWDWDNAIPISPDTNGKWTKIQVSNAIRIAFSKLYPDSKEVSWVYEVANFKKDPSNCFKTNSLDTFYLAHFKSNVTAISVGFSASGIQVYYHSLISDSLVPKTIISYLREKYHSRKAYINNKYVDYSGKTSYKVNLVKGWLFKKYYVAEFNEKGSFIKMEKAEENIAIDMVGPNGAQSSIHFGDERKLKI